MELSVFQSEMFSRQMMVPEIGEEGQKKLLKSSIFVAGCGGLGAPVLYYLAAMGIGRLGICDKDKVSLSNLNRQILFTDEDIRKPKTEVAKKRLLALNPELKVDSYDAVLDDTLANKLIKDYDIVIDCLDNFKTRFVLNDACLTAGKLLIHAAVGEFSGQILNIIPGKSPCLRCIFPSGAGEEKNSGIIGAVAGIIGSLQTLEAVKYLLGMEISYNEMFIFNGFGMSVEKVKILPADGCICRDITERENYLEDI